MLPGQSVRSVRSSPFPVRGPRLDPRKARQLAVYPCDTFDLPLGRKALVETIAPEGADLFRPGRQPSLPAFDAAFGGFGVLDREVGAHADHRFERDRLGDHVVIVAPRVAPDLRGGLEEVPHLPIVAFRCRLVGPFLLNLPPVLSHPAMDLIEQFGLQNPLLLLAASTQTVDPVAQRAVALAVEHLDYPRRKPAVRLRPRDALVEVHEVALVDAGRG